MDTKSTLPIAEDYHEAPETPERNLWFAVLERALKDYCFFFDKLVNTGNGHIIAYERMNDSMRQSFNLQAIAELNRLRWFIFDKEPQPFNLEYLAEQLYEDGEGAAQAIRKEAIKQFKRHFIEAETAGKFPVITAYIRSNIAVDKMQAAETESSLRFKRYRLIVS